MRHSPSGKSSIAPTSTFGSAVLVKAGSTAKTSAGTVTSPPMIAPTPSVEASRMEVRMVLSVFASRMHSSTLRVA